MRINPTKTQVLFNSTARFHFLMISLTVLALFAIPVSAQEGQFWRIYWFKPGAEFGNPGTGARVYVNAPDAMWNPNLKGRAELQSNGMLQIPIREDLTMIQRAEFYAELWGGNPGTTNKRVTINGRSTQPLPELGSAAGTYTYQYPQLFLQITDLVNGYNAFQFACDRGRSNWGHFAIDNAALKLELRKSHPDLALNGLKGFNALVRAEAIAGAPEKIRLKLLSSHDELIESVTYQGFYYGYDENGDSSTYGWHGMTKQRQPYGYIGTSTSVEFPVEWDVSMLPDQQDMAVRAFVQFKNHPEITFVTPVIGGLFAAKPKGVSVSIYNARNCWNPLTAAVSQPKTCTYMIENDPSKFERVELNVVMRGRLATTARQLFILNGVPIQIAGNGQLELTYLQIPVAPDMLKKGTNIIEFIPHTDHQNIEVLSPGPALMIRSK